MASNIVEFFGYSPDDRSVAAAHARKSMQCPFLGSQCTKKLSDGSVSGVCTLKQKNSGPVIICPIRLYADDYRILRDVAKQSVGDDKPLVAGNAVTKFRSDHPGEDCIAVFGKRWGKELRLPNRSMTLGKKAGGYFVDWVLAHIDGDGNLVNFVAIEVQSIDTTGNYQAERQAYLAGRDFSGTSTAGLNWENVNKRILPQIIYKGHVLRREPLCTKGLFFICPAPVYQKIEERLGGNLSSIHQQAGSLTVMWYDVGDAVPAGFIRDLNLVGQFTTTVDSVALAFTAPSNLPPPMVYEQAINAAL